MYFSSSLRFLLLVLCWTAAAASSQEQARVIASAPILSPSNTLNSKGEVIMVTMFNVVYEYAGKQYTVQMPYDPGPYVTLQITPTYSASTPAPPLPPAPQVIYVQPQAQVFATPVYVVPYSPPYYYSHPLPFTFNFGLGYFRWRR